MQDIKLFDLITGVGYMLVLFTIFFALIGCERAAMGPGVHLSVYKNQYNVNFPHGPSEVSTSDETADVSVNTTSGENATETTGYTVSNLYRTDSAQDIESTMETVNELREMFKDILDLNLPTSTGG